MRETAADDEDDLHYRAKRKEVKDVRKIKSKNKKTRTRKRGSSFNKDWLEA